MQEQSGDFHPRLFGQLAKFGEIGKVTADLAQGATQPRPHDKEEDLNHRDTEEQRISGESGGHTRNPILVDNRRVGRLLDHGFNRHGLHG